MNLLTPEIRAALLANMHARRDAQAQLVQVIQRAAE